MESQLPQAGNREKHRRASSSGVPLGALLSGLLIGILVAASVALWLLGTPTPEVRLAVERFHEERRAVDVLRSRDRLSEVEKLEKCDAAARRAVRRLGGPAEAVEKVEGYLKLDEEVAPHGAEAVELLGYCGRGAVGLIVRLLRQDDRYDTERAAAKACVTLGPDAEGAVPALIAALKSPDFLVRGFSARALGKIGPAAAPAALPLARLVEGKDYWMQWDAVEALGGIGPEARAAVPALERLLAGKSLEMRACAARSLWQISGDSKTAVERLKALLTEVDSRGPFPGGGAEAACGHAIETLGRIGPGAREAITLIEKIRSGNGTLTGKGRTAARKALRSIRGQKP